MSYMPADVTIFLHYIAGITWHVSQAINSFGVLKQCRFRNSASCEFNCSKLSKRNVNSRDLNLSALDLKKANIIQIRRSKTDIHSNETLPCLHRFIGHFPTHHGLSGCPFDLPNKRFWREISQAGYHF